MARALLGYLGTTPQHIQDVELARLRARVRDLEAEVAELRAEAAAHRALGHLEHAAQLEHADSVDAELSRIVIDSAVHA